MSQKKIKVLIVDDSALVRQILVEILKRARDIAIGVPTLLLWQAMEGKRALAPERSDGELPQS